MEPAVGAVVEVISDDEEVPVAVKPPADALEWDSHLLPEDFKGSGEGLDDSAAIQEFLASLEDDKKSGDDDDDCVMLDGDPVKAVVVAKERRPGEDGSEEELHIVAEKGEVACRDFPHPRHLCASLPFKTSSHARHCTMCHCYVCDSPAPCPNWGNGTLPTDHCHATDKVEKWNKLRHSLKCKSLPASKRGKIQKFSRASSTTPSSQQYTGHQVSVPQPFQPLGTTANQPSAGRVPVASNVWQNQQILQSIIAAQNVGQAVHLPKASAPGPKISHKRFKRSVAPPVVNTALTNTYNVYRALLDDAVLNPASSRVIQAAQVAPGSNIITGPSQGYPPQHSLNAPVISQGFRVQPTPHLQVAPNIAVGTGQQLSQCSMLKTQGTQCTQDPSADILQKSLKDALANLASNLGVSDYNINPQQSQQSASTQSLHPSQLLAHLRASQGVEPHRTYVAAGAQMRLSKGHHLPNHKPDGSVVSVQKSQALRLLNSRNNFTPK